MATQGPSLPDPNVAGMHPVRPVRYALSAVKGTATGLLDGMAKFGPKGMWAGLGLGVFVGFATGAVLGTALMYAAGGFVLGALGGAAAGAVTGGYNSATREARRDKYADEVAERQVARAAREARSAQYDRNHTNREAVSRRRTLNNYNFERQLQQERENDRDYSTYWQDRVDSGRGQGNGRGF